MTQRYLISVTLHTSHGHVVLCEDNETTQNVVRYQVADYVLDMLTRSAHLMDHGQKVINAPVTGYTFTISRLGDT